MSKISAQGVAIGAAAGAGDFGAGSVIAGRIGIAAPFAPGMATTPEAAEAQDPQLRPVEALPAAAGPQPALARLQRLLERFDTTDRHRAQRFADALPRIRDPQAIWLLLSWLDQAPAGALDATARFSALTRLAEADCGFLRNAAYRWLARMFLLDLRFEQHAKRALRRALDRETGLARARVRQLLRRC